MVVDEKGAPKGPGGCGIGPGSATHDALEQSEDQDGGEDGQHGDSHITDGAGGAFDGGNEAGGVDGRSLGRSFLSHGSAGGEESGRYQDDGLGFLDETHSDYLKVMNEWSCCAMARIAQAAAQTVPMAPAIRRAPGTSSQGSEAAWTSSAASIHSRARPVSYTHLTLPTKRIV